MLIGAGTAGLLLIGYLLHRGYRQRRNYELLQEVDDRLSKPSASYSRPLFLLVDAHLHSEAAEPKSVATVSFGQLREFQNCRQLLDGVYGDVDGLWEKKLRILHHICVSSRMLLELTTTRQAALE